MRSTALLLVALSIGAFDTAYKAIDSTQGTLVVEGACNITVDSVSCWKPDGESDPALTKKVFDFMSKEPREIEQRLGEETRYVVIGRNTTDPNAQGETPRAHEGGLIPVSDSLLGGKATQWLLPVKVAGKTIEVEVKTSKGRVAGDFALLPEKGQKSVSGDAVVEVLDIERIPRERMSPLAASFGPEFGWRVHVQTRNVRLHNLRHEGEFVTRDGKSFQIIDGEGNPNPDGGVKRSLKNLGRFNFGLDPISGKTWFDTTINPEKLGPVRFKAMEEDTATAKFADIPTNPKKSQPLRAAAPAPGPEPTLVANLIEAKGSSWEDPDLGKFEILGIFSLDGGKLRVWDVEGKPRPTMEPIIRTEIQSQKRPITVRFGATNRFVYGSWKGSAHLQSLTSTAGKVAQRPDFYRIETTANPKPADIILGISAIESNPVARLTLPDGGDFPVLKTVKTTGGPPAGVVMDSSRPVWRIYFDPKDRDLGKLHIRALTKGGHKLSMVDPEGEPIPGDTAPLARKPVVAFARVGRDVFGKDWWIDTNVNPDHLEEIGFTGVKQVQVRFKGVALAPVM